MASQHYNGYKLNALKGAIAPLTDTLKVALFTHNYTPNIDTDKFFSDISANETTGSGYTSGGVTLSSVTTTEDDTNDRGVLGAANASWPAVTFTDARWAVVYKSTGSPTTSPLMAVIDLLTQQTCSGSTFTITWNASGIYYLG